MASYFRMTIYFNFTRYAFSVHHYETILFENCMLRVLLSLRTRENHRCGRKIVLLAKPRKRCCETDRAMSHLPIGQAVKTEHWLVYASTRAKSPLVRREYRFRA